MPARKSIRVEDMAADIGHFQRSRYEATGQRNHGYSVGDMVALYGCSENAVRTALKELRRLSRETPVVTVMRPTNKPGRGGRPEITYCFAQGHRWGGWNKPAVDFVVVRGTVDACSNANEGSRG